MIQTLDPNKPWEWNEIGSALEWLKVFAGGGYLQFVKNQKDENWRALSAYVLVVTFVTEEDCKRLFTTPLAVCKLFEGLRLKHVGPFTPFAPSILDPSCFLKCASVGWVG